MNAWWSAGQPVDKCHMANCLILQTEDIFHMTFMLAIGQPTSKFNNVKVLLSDIYIYIYIYIIYIYIYIYIYI